MSFWADFLDLMSEWTLGPGLPAVARGVAAAVIIYLVALVITRTGKKRYLGRNTVFDLLLAFILGSVLSRAINGDATLVVTAVAGAVMVLMHFVMGEIAMRTKHFGTFVKGKPEAVMENGRIDEEAMRDHHLTRADLEEAARQDGVLDLDQVDAAYFERNGRLSIIRKEQVRVIDVDVRAGVQTVRVEISG